MYTVQCSLCIVNTKRKKNSISETQTTQTAYLLSQGGLRRPKVDPARHVTFLG